jgi:hypothetical protein
LSVFLVHPSDISKLSCHEWFLALISIAAIGGGLMLSILLSRRPLRIWALMLAAVSLFLLWKQLFVLILVQMDARGGSLTFSAAFTKWWAFITRNTLSSLIGLPFIGFLLLSALAWPCYAVLYGESDDSLPNFKPVTQS